MALQTAAQPQARTARTTRARIAILGLGRMGAIHVDNALRLPSVELVAVADGDQRRTAELSARAGVPGAADLEQLLELQPDGIVVATPSDHHAAAIAQAAAAGVHVFCEKPIAPRLADAERAVATAEAAGIVLQVGFQMRFDRDLVALEALLAGGELGRPFQFHARLRDVAPPPADYLAGSGGYFRDGAIHCFDLARWLMGEVAEVTAFGAALSSPLFDQIGDVDNAIAVLRFASGALGTVEVSRVAGYGFDSAVEVVGSAGTARVAGAASDGLVRCRDGRVEQAHVQDFGDRFAAAYPRELDAFAAAIAAAESISPVSGADGLAAMRLAEAAAESHRRGATVRL